jgi:acetyltransferase-like isoleucine patch superfamily enzyme
MMRKLLKQLAHKIYSIGEFEAKRRALLKQTTALEQKAIINSKADVSVADICNNQQDRSKIVVGEMSVIQGQLLVYKHGGEIIVGDHCFIGPGCKIWSSKKISIGNRVLISHNVNIHDSNSHPLDAKLRHEDFLHIFSKGLQDNIDLREAEVVIEDDAWIGFNAIILKGVTIGKGAIIGAGTIVTKDVPAYTIVAGGTYRVIKRVDE